MERDILLRAARLLEADAPPVSPEAYDHCRKLVTAEVSADRTGEAWNPAKVEECAEDLMDFLRIGQREGWTQAESIHAWLQEWGLT